MAGHARTFFIALGLLAVFFSGSLAQEKVRFATHQGQSPEHSLPVMAAMERGYWQEQGVTIEWVRLAGGQATSNAIAAGAVDMGTHSSADLVLGIVAGVPAVLVADLGYSAGFSLYVLPNSPLRNPRDLKGTKIGTIQAGGITYNYAVALLKALGLEGQVKIVALGGGAPARIAALKAGITESSLGGFSMMAPLIVKGEVRELVKLSDYLPTGVEAVVVFAHRSLGESKPDLAKKVIKGFLKGAAFVMENKDWAISHMQKEFRHPRESAELVWQRMGYGKTGSINKDTIKSAIKFLVDYGLVSQDKVPPLEKVMLPDF